MKTTTKEINIKLAVTTALGSHIYTEMKIDEGKTVNLRDVALYVSYMNYDTFRVVDGSGMVPEMSTYERPEDFFTAYCSDGSPVETFRFFRSVPRSVLSYMYDDGGASRWNTSIDYIDKKEIGEKEKAARVLHWFKLAAVNYCVMMINNGIELNRDEEIFFQNCINNSISKGTGKMEGINSISTACFLNEQCKKNAAVPGSICSHCYAFKTLARYRELSRKLEINTAIFTGCIIPAHMLPRLNDLVFRFESFGDLRNVIQVENYFNIVKENPRVSFGWWTKNPRFIDEYLKTGNEKPENVRIGVSSLFVNMPIQNKRYAYFTDFVFTVYSPDYIENNNIDINCGGRHCLTCQNCYRKEGAAIVNEKLK